MVRSKRTPAGCGTLSVETPRALRTEGAHAAHGLLQREPGHATQAGKAAEQYRRGDFRARGDAQYIRCLTETFAPASSSSSLILAASSFDSTFLHLARNAFDQVLGFLQTRLVSVRTTLITLILLVAETFQARRRIRSLLPEPRHRRRTVAARTSHHHGAGRARAGCRELLRGNRSIPWLASASGRQSGRRGSSCWPRSRERERQ